MVLAGIPRVVNLFTLPAVILAGIVVSGLLWVARMSFFYPAIWRVRVGRRKQA